MHLAALLWLPLKLAHSAEFLLYRLAAWTGTGYLYRRWRRERRRGYLALALGVYAASWLAVLVLSRGCREWLHALLAGISHHIRGA